MIIRRNKEKVSRKGSLKGIIEGSSSWRKGETIGISFG